MKTSEPTMMAAPLPCRYSYCGIPTLWHFPGQSTHGTCLDHAPAFWRPLSPAGDRVALKILARAFPGLTAIQPPPRLSPGDPGLWGTVRVRLISPVDPAAWVRRIHGPLTTSGPCALCRRLTRVYETWGSPLCTECEGGKA